MRRHARYIKSQLQRTDSLTANFFLCSLRNLSSSLKLPGMFNHCFVDSKKKPDELYIKFYIIYALQSYFSVLAFKYLLPPKA